MIDPRFTLRALSHYREPDELRAVFELSVTSFALIFSWVLMWLSLDVGYWLTLLLSIPAAGFLVRLFMIQHDCGHGAFFRRCALNDWVGRVLGVLTLTPYDYWKRNHAIHHATSGNLDRRGVGDIMILTVAEYRARSSWGRVWYRIYRNPIVIFGIGPAYLFVLQHRLPLHQMRLGWGPWASTMATNVAIALAVTTMILLVGMGPFLLVHLPIILLAASMGVWLFYVQHQFKGVTWARDANWVHRSAAISGSSYYDLPIVLRWFTANIGIHHVHHLNSRIPFYRLQQVLHDHPELRRVGRVTIPQSLRSVRQTLWCESSNELIGFADLRQ